IQGGAGSRRTPAVPDRARPNGRQRHGRGRGQRAGERAGMTSLDALAGTAVCVTLYGVGVGPGDVRYLTLRAAGLVRAVDVVAYFAKKGLPGNARRIVAPLMAEGRVERRFEYPLTDEMPAESTDYQRQMGAFYRATADALSALLRQGKSVGLLAEGDPFFYGSFMHMLGRVGAALSRAEVVP